MSIKVTQTCELCGKERDLPMATRQSRTPAPDSGGWRLLSHGSREITACDSCVLLIVVHGQERASARKGGHAGNINERPLTLHFHEHRER